MPPLFNSKKRSGMTIVLLIGTLAVFSVVAVLVMSSSESEYAFAKKPKPNDDPGGGGCGDIDTDGDGKGDGCDECPNLWNGAGRPCPDPLAEITLVAGPGSPGPMDGIAYLNVHNDSSYSYRVDLGATSSHAYCPTCSNDSVYTGTTEAPCAWAANCAESNNPNPGPYGGKFGTDGAIAPCSDDVLAPGDNQLHYSPFHHCCDITKDVLYAAYLVIAEYRYVGDTTWQTFPSPAPTIAGWASNEHVARVGFTFDEEIDAGGDPAVFTIPDTTVPACSIGGLNEHYAGSSADFDGDGIPDACDCDDDNDGCLDGYDITNGQDSKQDCCEAPFNCDTGDTTITSCDGNLSLFGRYANFPFACRGYASVPQTCPPGTCTGCTPDCAGRECGDDGCEGTCPPGCESGTSCNDGICGACQPDCVGRNCGDDGCGGSCGPCVFPNRCKFGVCQ